MITLVEIPVKKDKYEALYVALAAGVMAGMAAFLIDEIRNVVSHKVTTEQHICSILDEHFRYGPNEESARDRIADREVYEQFCKRK